MKRRSRNTYTPHHRIGIPRRENHFIRIVIIFSVLLILTLSIWSLGSTQNLSFLSFAETSSSEPELSAYEQAPPVNLENYISENNQNVVYCKGGTENLTIDIYIPKVAKASPNPFVLYVHGGGWNHGDKDGTANKEDWVRLLESGYTVGSANYRLAPSNKFSSFVQDIKCAVRYIRANALTYQVNPNRIGIWGGSAGSQIASLVAFSNSEDFVNSTAEFVGISSKPQVFVGYSGFYDLQSTIYNSNISSKINDAFGAYPGSGKPVLEKASAINYVTSNDPPAFIVQADMDNTAPISQAFAMRDVLKKKGVKYNFLEVTNGRHTFVAADKSKPMEPSRGQIGSRMVKFFDQNL